MGVNTLERLGSLGGAASFGNSRASREITRHGDEAGPLAARATESTSGNSSRSGITLATLSTMMTVLTARAETTARLGTTGGKTTLATLTVGSARLWSASNVRRNGTRAMGTHRLLSITAETVFGSTARTPWEIARHTAGGLRARSRGGILQVAELRRHDEYRCVREKTRGIGGSVYIPG